MFAAHLAVGAVPRLVPQVDPDVVPVSDDVTRQAVAAGHAVGGGGAGHHHPHVPLWVRGESHITYLSLTHRPWSEPTSPSTGTGGRRRRDGPTTHAAVFFFKFLLDNFILPL